MINGKSVCAVIPARAGSVRVKNKNLRTIAGLTLIEWAICNAKESHYIDDIMLSTDIPRDQLHSIHMNGVHIARRPDHLCSGTADIADVVKDVSDHRALHDYFITLQPATPLRTGKLIDSMLEYMTANKCRSALTMAECVPWTWSLYNDIGANCWTPKPYPRSQDYIYTNAQEINTVQIAHRDIVKQGQRWGTPLAVAMLPTWATLDIDTEHDLAACNELYRPMRTRLLAEDIKMRRLDTINGRKVNE